MNRGRRGEKIFATKEDYGSFVDLLEDLDKVFNVNKGVGGGHKYIINLAPSPCQLIFL